MSNCLSCGSLTKNPKFCSKSCSASYNNKLRVKSRRKTCADCEKQVTNGRLRCREHYLIWIRNKELKDITLEEAVYKTHYRSSAFALIRTRARAEAKKLGMSFCERCGYSKHVEIAHKRAIASFDSSTLISQINAKENLMALCPNCHWEYDHGL